MIICECCGEPLTSWSVRFGGSNTTFCKTCFKTPEANKIIEKRFLETLGNSEYLNHDFINGECIDCGLNVEYVYESKVKCKGPSREYQSKSFTNDAIQSHDFIDGYCKKCGWSYQFAMSQNRLCPVVSDFKYENFDANGNHGPNSSSNFNSDYMNSHRFVDGYCQNCGWSYELAYKNLKNCPINPDYNSKQNQRSEKEEPNSNRKHKSYSENVGNLSEAAKYGQILGLKGKVTVSDIKLKYKELSKKYHPDRVTNLGPEFIEIAERKMKEINDAYSWFRKKHKF